jgi:hypothetical protein
MYVCIVYSSRYVLNNIQHVGGAPPTTGELIKNHATVIVQTETVKARSLNSPILSATVLSATVLSLHGGTTGPGPSTPAAGWVPLAPRSPS